MRVCRNRAKIYTTD